MSWRILSGWFIFYLIVALLSGVMTLIYLPDSVASIFSTLFAPPTPAYTNPVGGITMLISATGAIMTALWKFFLLDWPIFDGWYQIFRWLLLCIPLGIISYLILTNFGRSS
jgi:hypothetical protein